MRLPFTNPWLLAPMEGVTAPSFRDLVLARHAPDELGGACTEFVRVNHAPVQAQEIRRHLGCRRFRIPVGVQLMGRDPLLVAASAEVAVETGAAWIDLNFGCPAKGALRGSAGASTLKEPNRLERLVAACVKTVGDSVPVTAKIRAGYDDATRVERLAQAAESGGASLVTVHCRTFVERYKPEVNWSRIARAVEAVQIPVCGNGGIECHDDLQRMRAETGCDYAMVGHGALADPWIFSGRRVTRSEAAEFLLEYHEAMRIFGGGDISGPIRRVKHLLRHWTAADLIVDEADRESWLREADAEELLNRLQACLESRQGQEGQDRVVDAGPTASPQPFSTRTP